MPAIATRQQRSQLFVYQLWQTPQVEQKQQSQPAWCIHRHHQRKVLLPEASRLQQEHCTRTSQAQALKERRKRHR